MGLETVTHISDLVVTNPVGGVDPKSQGDDHIRNIKVALKTDFPNITGVVSATQTALNGAGALYTADAAAAGMLADIAALTDPNADRILFWDDSAGAVAGLAADGITISISGTTLSTGSNVPLLNATNSFTAKQTITVGDGTIALDLVGPVSKIRMFGDVSGGAKIQARNIADSAYKALGIDGLTLAFTTNTGVNSEITMNGVAVSDFARLSQSNVFTGALQTISAASAAYKLTDSTVTGFFDISGTNLELGSTSAHPLNLYTSGSVRLTVGSTGNFDFKAGTVTTNNASASEVGYKGLPQNSQSGNYTCVLADAGKHIINAGSGGPTTTIPANASVAYPLGTVLTFVNNAGDSAAQFIAITSDTVILAGTNTTGTRTLAYRGIATALKVASNAWYISGTGLS